MEIEQLQKDMIAAMKAKDKPRKEAISSLVSEDRSANLCEAPPSCRSFSTQSAVYYVKHGRVYAT